MIRCRLRILIAQKAERERRKKPHTMREISQETGLSTNVVNRYVNDDFDRIDKSTVEALCRWVPCTVGELLVYEEETGAEP